MAKIALNGDVFNTVGDLPAVGDKAPQFVLTAGDLSDVSLSDYAGKRILLNIVPSLDTPVCAVSTKKFNDYARQAKQDIFASVSMDLPFAQSRFCSSEGLENVITLSAFRSNFPDVYGIKIADGPLMGVTARAVVVVDGAGVVRYTQLVPEISHEPDYAEALKALQSC